MSLSEAIRDNKATSPSSAGFLISILPLIELCFVSALDQFIRGCT